jgi:DNA-binding MarR family transcriptional regulator
MTLFRTSDRAQHRLGQMVSEHGLTGSQYHVLRILRAEGGRLPCLAIAGRTFTVVPGITGLIDRLAEKTPPLVRRERGTDDRRVAHVSLTAAGEALLALIDEPMARLHRHFLSALDAAEAAELGRLLALVHGRAESDVDA